MPNLTRVRIFSAFMAAFAAVATYALASMAIAGPGHDHGPSAAFGAGSTSPRFVATSEAYELVGILKGKALTLYLDRMSDTSPVSDARIELIIDGETGAAETRADGTYNFESTSLIKEGEHEVIATISHKGNSDLLVGSLTVPHDRDEHEDHYDHEHALHHSEDGKSVERTVPAPILQVLQRAGYSSAELERKFSNHSFLAGLVLMFGILLGALLRLRTGLTIGLVGLATVFSAGVAWAGPGHDHGHNHGGVAEQANGDAPRRLPDGAVFLPKPTQRLLQVRTRVLAPETARATRRLIGRVIADPNRAGLVQSTIGGRIKPTENGLPTLGQAVKAGEVLAHVEPAFAPIDRSDVRQTAGDLEQRIALLKARMRRLQTLVRKDFASRSQLEDLQIELQGLEARRRTLNQSREQPEALKAPVDGLIAAVSVASGQVVKSGETLFQIVDPGSLWIEAVSYDPRLSVGGPGLVARTAEGDVFQLSFVGRSRALQQQAVVLHFRVNDPTGALNIGSPVKVLVETGKPVTGLIVPRAAIAQAPNGQMVAFKRLAPERYDPKAVRFEDVDAERVQVIDGLKAGDQIIVRGAPLVNQIR